VLFAFDRLVKKIKFFSSIDDRVSWCKKIRFHGALAPKTPIDAYFGKIPHTDILADPHPREGDIVITANHLKRHLQDLPASLNDSFKK
jgi:hypothetical protein